MDDLVAVLEKARNAGLRVWAEGDALQVEGRETPESLAVLDVLRQRKPDLLVYLWEHPEPPQKSYRFVYPGEGKPGDAELAELERRVHEYGYVLLWSTVLEDFIAFYKTEADRNKILPGFVPYSEQELRELFGEGEAVPSASGLRLIHQAKKYRGRIVSPGPDTEKAAS